MFDLKKVQSCLDSDGWYLEYNIDSYKCLCQRYENDFQWLGALKKLENLVNLHYKIMEKEMEQKQSENDDGSRLTKNYVDNQMDIRPLQSDKMLSYDKQAGTRLKALELSLEAFECFGGSTSIFLSPPFIEENIIPVAQRFYNYIIKGE